MVTMSNKKSEKERNKAEEDAKKVENKDAAKADAKSRATDRAAAKVAPTRSYSMLEMRSGEEVQVVQLDTFRSADTLLCQDKPLVVKVDEFSWMAL